MSFKLAGIANAILTDDLTVAAIVLKRIMLTRIKSEREVAVSTGTLAIASYGVCYRDPSY